MNNCHLLSIQTFAIQLDTPARDWAELHNFDVTNIHVVPVPRDLY